jgi:hypothetical protein
LSTPFALFFLKKAQIYPSSKIKPTKSIGYVLKKFQHFFKIFALFLIFGQRGPSPFLRSHVKCAYKQHTRENPVNFLENC